MDVGVTGSVAFDHIMSFGGQFQDHILPEKIHAINISFLVDDFQKRRGGCAANIAYACSLHDLKAGVVAAVGRDIGEYRSWLEERGIDLRGLRVFPEEHTASCFITTDRRNNQITGFFPGAMGRAGELSLEDPALGRPRIVVISPNDPKAMKRYPGECRRLGIPFVYDPGQQVIALAAGDLKDGLHGARAVIVNDYEFATIQNKLGASTADLLELAETIVVTLGSDGSRIERRDGAPLVIPIAPPRVVGGPTGCGDAYRGGFIAGLLAKRPLEVCGRMGALTATYCLEVTGTTEYAFNAADFRGRYREVFGVAL